MVESPPRREGNVRRVRVGLELRFSVLESCDNDERAANGILYYILTIRLIAVVSQLLLEWEDSVYC